MDANSQAPTNADVDRAMESLQELLASLGAGSSGSNDSLSKEEEVIQHERLKFPPPETPEITLGRPPEAKLSAAPSDHLDSVSSPYVLPDPDSPSPSPPPLQDFPTIADFQLVPNLLNKGDEALCDRNPSSGVSDGDMISPRHDSGTSGLIHCATPEPTQDVPAEIKADGYHSVPYHKDNVFAGQQPQPSVDRTGKENDRDKGKQTTEPSRSTQDYVDGGREHRTSSSDTESLTPDDVINAMKLKENQMALLDKLFADYPEELPAFSAPDGGYAWVILAASFFLQGLTIALPLSFGVFYIELLSYFEDTSTNTAWIGAIAAGFGLGAGPVSSVLVKHLGFRLTCIIGGLVSAVGMFVSSFAPNIFMLYGSFGFLTGMGVSISYIPAADIIGYYFEKRRSMANGIAGSGCAVGIFVYPVVIEALILTYTWRGAMIVLSAVILNCCVFGALLRPTRCSRIIRRNDRSKTLKCELFSDWRFCLFCLSEILRNAGLLVLLTAAPDRAYLMRISEEKSALLLSIAGIGSFVGRIIMAFVTHPKHCDRLLCLAVATLVTVFPMALFTISGLYPVLATLCLIYGLGFGFQLGLLAVVTTELFTVEKLAGAYGYVMLSDGIGAFLGPLLCGVLYDASGTYFVPFIFGSAVSLLAAFIFFILVIHQYHRKKSKGKAEERAERDIEDHYHREGFF